MQRQLLEADQGMPSRTRWPEEHELGAHASLRLALGHASLRLALGQARERTTAHLQSYFLSGIHHFDDDARSPPGLVVFAGHRVLQHQLIPCTRSQLAQSSEDPFSYHLLTVLP